MSRLNSSLCSSLAPSTTCISGGTFTETSKPRICSTATARGHWRCATSAWLANTEGWLRFPWYDFLLVRIGFPLNPSLFLSHGNTAYTGTHEAMNMFLVNYYSYSIINIPTFENAAVLCPMSYAVWLIINTLPLPLAVLWPRIPSRSSRCGTVLPNYFSARASTLPPSTCGLLGA